MSSSYDDRRRRVPPTLQPRFPIDQGPSRGSTRPQHSYPPSAPFDDQQHIDPRTVDPRWQDPRDQDQRRVPIDYNDPVTGPATYEVDYPTGRAVVPPARPVHVPPDAIDIEPPIDSHGNDHLQDAYRNTMQQHARGYEQPAGADPVTHDPFLPKTEARVSALPPPPGSARFAPATTTARGTLPAAGDDLIAPTRVQQTGPERAQAPIVPPGSVTGRSLNLVIAIMCFLACLTAGAVYMINQTAAAWLRDVASEVTVQVEARERTDVERTVGQVTKFLESQAGIRAARALTVNENAELLEPWLGQADALKALPVPRLIALDIDRNRTPDLDALRTALTSQFKGVTLDDHRHWQRQIRTVTQSLALGGLAILMLVGAATTAIIVSATRAALAANREIVEVLHFVGATDKFIAREFEKHFLRLGIRAGIIGALAAVVVFLTLPFLMELLGGGVVTMAELRRMIGSGTLDWPGYVLLAVVVCVISALCMLTSRIGVYRILHSQH